MNNKLVYRNAMRSVKDYFIYLLTMGFIAAFMFAFDMMLFSDALKVITSDMTAMAVMMGLATFFIIIIVAWLINYMVRFMLEKRSREFGTYLLLGMKNKQISRMYLRENVLLGTIAFVVGCPLGWLLQQVILSIFDSMFELGYKLEVAISGYGMLMTVLCYFSCFIIALFRNKKKFKSLNIIDLMTMDQKNEKIDEKYGALHLIYFLGSIAYFIFYIWYICKAEVTILGVMLGGLAFIVAIYLFYVGISSFVVKVIRKQGNHLFKRQHLFLYRQLSVKLKTMQFTMGTLTVLFTCALLFGTMAMMLSKYQKNRADIIFPFDAIIFSEDVNDTFEQEKEEISKDHQVDDTLVYNIYENGSNEMNEYMYTHLSVIGDAYKNSDGSANVKKIEEKGWQYYRYDTYMTLSDYNHLRSMLGYETVDLSDNGYIVQIKKTLRHNLDQEFEVRKLTMGNENLNLEKICTEEFGQMGHNGADYVIVVPDRFEKDMTPYYRVMAMDITGPISRDLTQRLIKIKADKIRQNVMNDRQLDIENGCEKPHEYNSNGICLGTWDTDLDESGDAYDGSATRCKQGSDQIISYTADILVSENAQVELKFILTAMVFPLMYINLVFVCVAFTILAVQQLSDSHKYRYRFTMLEKLGLRNRSVHGLVLRQLSMFYLCPIAVAVILSVPVSLFLSKGFNFYTGVSESVFIYYGISLLIFLGVYSLYFVATYVGVVRNIEE